MLWSIMLPIIFILSLVIIFVLLFQGKGALGEKRVSHILEKLPKDRYTVFNDVMFRTEFGSTQIDHIVVSPYGVFVIETKTMQGWIYGSENDKYWTQNIYGNKYQLYNPIFQNYGHVRALRNILGSNGNIFIFPIVAFSWQATLKVHLKESCVVYWPQLLSIIESFNERKLTDEQVRLIGRRICDYRVDTSEKNVRLEHKRNVMVAKNYSEAKPLSTTCPKCGGRLTLRHGKYGNFYGCSNYPTCSYTRKIQ